MLYLSLVSQYDKSVISPSIIAHLMHASHPPNRETSNFLYQLCASFKVIPILWAEKKELKEQLLTC